MTHAHRRPVRLAVVGLTIVLAVSACGTEATTPSAPANPTSPITASASAEAVPSGSHVPAASVDPSPAGSPPTSGTTDEASIDQELAKSRALPEPRVEDPFEIGQSLYDPSRVEQAVVSLIDRLGIPVDAADGTPLRPGDGRAADDYRLTEPEVWGLISMGVDDLLAGPEGSLPFTFADLHAGVAPFLPGVSARDLARQYDSAYAREPDALVPSVMLGQPIDVDTPLTRVHLWLLLLDGFVGTAGDRTASLGAVPGPDRARWGTAARLTTPLTPPPGMQPADLADVLVRLRTEAFRLGFGITGDMSTVHEGHGGPGRAATFTAGTFGAPASPAGLAPYGRAGLPRPFDLTLRTTDPGLWRSHGRMAVEFGQPIRTRLVTRARFQPKQEVADGRGELVWDTALMWATANAAELVSSAYDLPFAPAELAAIIPGEVSSPRVTVGLVWHTEAGIHVGLKNEFDIDLGLQGTIGIGDVSGRGWDEVQGFLPLQDDGTYRGTLIASGQVTASCAFLGVQGTETVTSTQSLDVFAQVRPAGRHDPTEDVVSFGTLGPDDAHLTFYPAGPPIDADGGCIRPIWSRGGGPLGLTGLTYRWFNDSRWTDPTRGYTIGLPERESAVNYVDQRLSSKALSGPGGISGVHSIWSVGVLKVGH